MICSTCDRQNICNIHRLLNIEHITADVKDCRHYKDNRRNTTYQNNVFSPGVRRDLATLEKTAQKIKKVATTDNQSVPNKDNGLSPAALCDQCEENYATVACCICGVDLCEDCAQSNVDGFFYCQKCFDSIDTTHRLK